MSARADAVDDWSRIALDAAVAENADLAHVAYTVATVNAAMFEALLQLGGPDTTTYTPRYTIRVGAQWGPVSRRGIAAVAAHQVLLRAFPHRALSLHASLGESMAAIDARPSAAVMVMARSMADIVWTVRGHGPELADGLRHGARMLALAGTEELPLVERARRLAASSPTADGLRASRDGGVETVARVLGR